MKLSSEMLQILPYFWNKKSPIAFFVFHFEQLWICNSGMPWSMSKNMANFEAIRETISTSINILFLKSEHTLWPQCMEYFKVWNYLLWFQPLFLLDFLTKILSLDYAKNRKEEKKRWIIGRILLVSDGYQKDFRYFIIKSIIWGFSEAFLIGEFAHKFISNIGFVGIF